MRRRGVLSVLAGCAALLAVAIPGLGAASAAPPPVTIAGSLPAAVAGPGTETLDYTITVSGADIDGAVLTATEPVGMTADPATVRVDGVDPPAGTVSQQGDGLTIRLGAGADAAQGGTLAIGAYLITFDIAVPATVPANSTASASLAFTRNAVPDNATSNTVSLSGPDLGLSVPTDSGEDQILPLGTGQTGFYDAELTNPGADATGVTLTITVPKGLTIDTTADPVTRDDHWQTDDGADAAPITCTTPSSTMTCVVGAVAHDADTLLEIPVTATPHGTPGAEVQLIMSVTPDAGVEANPADNTLTATIRLTGIAVLDFTLTPSAHRVQIGATIDITTSVRNDGPQPAEEAVALALTDTDTTFKIVGFTGNTAPPALPALAARAAKHVVSFNRQAAGRGAAATRGRPGPLGAVVTSGTPGASATPGTPGTSVVWFIGTIPAHSTAKATLKLKAVAAGSTQLVFLGGSDAGNPVCDNPSSDSTPCHQFTQITLTAVSAVSSTPPTTTAPTTPPTTPLGNTGSPVGALLLTGLTAVAAGAALTVGAGRMRPRSRPRHI